MAVIIPLHIFQLGGVYYRAHIFNDIIADLRPCQIQHQLIASLCRASSRHFHRPIGVSSVQIRVLVDHLRLEPQSEVHTHSANGFCHSLNSVGKLFKVGSIVTQACMIVVSFPEPAVIQHEKLHAQLFGSACQPYQLSVGESKKMGLPVIGQHRALHVFPVAADNIAVDEAVEISAKTVEALVRTAHYRLGRFEALTGMQSPVKAAGVYAQHHADNILTRALHSAVMAAGIDKVEAPYSAVVLSRAPLAEEKAGIMAVGGCPR